MKKKLLIIIPDCSGCCCRMDSVLRLSVELGTFYEAS